MCIFLLFVKRIRLKHKFLKSTFFEVGTMALNMLFITIKKTKYS